MQMWRPLDWSKICKALKLTNQYLQYMWLLVHSTSAFLSYSICNFEILWQYPHAHRNCATLQNLTALPVAARQGVIDDVKLFQPIFWLQAPSSMSMEGLKNIFRRTQYARKISVDTLYIHILLWQLSIMVVFVTIRAVFFLILQLTQLCRYLVVPPIWLASHYTRQHDPLLFVVVLLTLWLTVYIRPINPEVTKQWDIWHLNTLINTNQNKTLLSTGAASLELAPFVIF